MKTVATKRNLKLENRAILDKRSRLLHNHSQHVSCAKELICPVKCRFRGH